MLTEFELAFNGEVGIAPTHELLELRFHLHDEENQEVAEELANLAREVELNELHVGGDLDPIYADLTKKIADNIYVLVGTAVVLGLPLKEAFAEVHRSNMSKLGENGKPIYREDGKVLKGPNYTKADIQQFFPSLN